MNFKSLRTYLHTILRSLRCELNHVLLYNDYKTKLFLMGEIQAQKGIMLGLRSDTPTSTYILLLHSYISLIIGNTKFTASLLRFAVYQFIGYLDSYITDFQCKNRKSFEILAKISLVFFTCRNCFKFEFIIEQTLLLWTTVLKTGIHVYMQEVFWEYSPN